MTDAEKKAANKAQAEYYRQYRKQNPEKVRETRLRYWAKKAAQQAAAREERAGNE